MLRIRARTSGEVSHSFPAMTRAQLYMSEVGMIPKSRLNMWKKSTTLKSLLVRSDLGQNEMFMKEIGAKSPDSDKC